VVDTKYFNEAFKERLLASFDNIDEACDGVIINSENFQALNLLLEKYREQVKCVYIDPPYNSKTSEILYKNTYKHSSWLSLINDRLNIGKRILNTQGVYVVAIDENEQEVLGCLLSSTLPDFAITCVSIVHNKKGIQGDYFSYCHEFAYFCLPPNHNKIEGRPLVESDWDWDNLRKWGRESERETARNCFYPIFIKDKKITGFGDVCKEDEHPSKANVKRQDGIIAVYPIDSSGVERKWRYERGTVEDILNILRVHHTREGEYQIQKARTHDNIKTVWADSRYIAGDYGTTILTNLGVKPHSNLYPKSIYTVIDSIQSVSNIKSIILDYFAGSGTTAHAVINLNREDGGKRKYTLVEMGQYFDTVLKPRIQKVIYSKDWKDGKPVSREGISHMFKYMKLESYEDTLDNLIIKCDKKQQKALDSNKTAREEYMLGYWLDIETRGSDSLLNIDKFEDPFNYTLSIRHDNELKTTKIDLVETFNYLIGLYVEQTEVICGFKVIRGRFRTGEKSLVIWRNTKEKSNKDLDTFFLEQSSNTQDFEFDRIFVNGDNNLENLKVAEDKWKVSLIEEEFKKRMFDVKDV